MWEALGKERWRRGLSLSKALPARSPPPPRGTPPALRSPLRRRLPTSRVPSGTHARSPPRRRDPCISAKKRTCRNVRGHAARPDVHFFPSTFSYRRRRSISYGLNAPSGPRAMYASSTAASSSSPLTLMAACADIIELTRTLTTLGTPEARRIRLKRMRPTSTPPVPRRRGEPAPTVLSLYVFGLISPPEPTEDRPKSSRASDCNVHDYSRVAPTHPCSIGAPPQSRALQPKPSA